MTPEYLPTQEPRNYPNWRPCRLKPSGMPSCGPRRRSDIVDLGLFGRTFGSRLVMLHIFTRTKELANLMVKGLGFQTDPVESPKDEMQASKCIDARHRPHGIKD